MIRISKDNNPAAITDPRIKTEAVTYNSNTIVANNGKGESDIIDQYFGNNSFSGADMLAIMNIPNVDGMSGTYVLGSLQTITYSTHMQRSPIRSIGNVNAKDYVMGPRTIAGSLVFAVFDRHFAYAAMESIQGKNEGYHFLADEIPPFDITLTMANEYGKKAKLVIYGVRLINEGQVMSVNDIYTENTYQFVAHDLDYLSDQTSNASGTIYDPLTPNPGTTSEATKIDLTQESFEPENTIENTNEADNIFVLAEPSNAYYDKGDFIEGKVKLDLNKRKPGGILEVENINTGNIYLGQSISDGTQFPIVLKLKKGNYRAYYKDAESNKMSKYTFFDIHELPQTEVKPAAPILVLEEKMADGYLVGLKIIDNIGEGIKYGKLKPNNGQPDTWETMIAKDKMCFIRGLDESSNYIFKAYNSTSLSDPLTIHIDGLIDYLFSDFYIHIQANKAKIDDLTFLAFENIWKQTKAIKDKYLIYSLSACIAEARKKHGNDSMNAFYVFYEKEAALYLKERDVFRNRIVNVKTPILVNVSQSLIEFEQNIEKLKIQQINGPAKIIDKHLFIKHDDKYRYKVSGKMGTYAVTAIGIYESIEAAPIHVTIFSQKDSEDLFEEAVESSSIFTSKKEELANGEGNWIIQSDLTASEKNELLEELCMDKIAIKTDIPAPVIVQNTSSQIRVFVQIPKYKEDYYIVKVRSSVIGDLNLHERIKITKKQMAIDFFASKHALIDKTRYSFWIEDAYGQVVTKMTSVMFNQEDNSQSDIKNSQTAQALKKLYTEAINKEAVDTNLEYEFNTTTTLDSIIKNNYLLPMTQISRENILADSIKAKSKYYYSFIEDKPKDLVINIKAGKLSGDFSYMPYTHVKLDWYDRESDQCSNSDVVAIDANATLFNSYDNQLGVCVSFLNKDSTKSSMPVTIDFLANRSYAVFPVKVVYK